MNSDDPNQKKKKKGIFGRIKKFFQDELIVDNNKPSGGGRPKPNSDGNGFKIPEIPREYVPDMFKKEEEKLSEIDRQKME